MKSKITIYIVLWIINSLQVFAQPQLKVTYTDDLGTTNCDQSDPLCSCNYILPVVLGDVEALLSKSVLITLTNSGSSNLVIDAPIESASSNWNLSYSIPPPWVLNSTTPTVTINATFRPLAFSLIGSDNANLRMHSFADVGCFEDVDLSTPSELDFGINLLANVQKTVINWDGSTDSDWGTADNWDVGVVPTSTDNVVISDVSNGSGNSPEISGDQAVNELTINAGGKLVVKSGASLAIFGQVTNNGDFSVLRNTVGSAGYSILSSPVTGAALNELILADYIYSFDGTSYSSNLKGSTDAITPGRGYFVGSNEASPSMEFVGTPNTGTITYAVTDTHVELVGNPFSAAISISSFLTANSEVISGAVYFWDDGGSNLISGKRGGDYITANGMGSASAVQPDGVDDGVSGSQGTGGADNGYITSTQGVYVEAIATGNVTFTQDMQVTTAGANVDANHYRKVECQSYEKVKLAIAGNNMYNEILVGLGEDAALGRDAHLDAKKFVSGNALSFYSIIEDEKYVIQGLPLASSDSVTTKLGFDLAVSGSFTMSVVNIENMSADVNVTLLDHLTGLSYDLKKTKSFDFSTDIVQNDQRFELIFSPVEILASNAADDSDLTIFRNESGLIVRTKEVMSSATVKIYALSGALVFDQENIDLSSRQFKTPFSRKGLYILTLESESGFLVKKFLN